MKQQQDLSGKVNLFVPSSAPCRADGRQRWAYRLLRKIGPTWRYTPARRVTQLLCLTVFCYLFFYVAWPYSTVFTESVLEDKERIPVEVFLWLDPLVGLTTTVAARHWNIALFGMAGILLICLLSPRGYCGYICPLGTLIDGFDWFVGRHITRFQVKRSRGWVRLKYYLLTLVLSSALFGVILSGYVAAIPVLTRGLMFTVARIQLGLMKGWNQAGAMTGSMYVSVLLFAGVLLLGLLGKRFWCRYICPTGAVFSVLNLLRVGERRVTATCTGCKKCIESCPFNAIEQDYATRTLDCSFCQTCGGVCPSHAIDFVMRWKNHKTKTPTDPAVIPTSLSRRGFVVSGAAGIGAAIGMRLDFKGASLIKSRLLRPPGSVAESEFLNLCIRCGECFKVCPGSVLQPAGLEFGWEALWTPVLVPSHAGCHQDCNFCTQICPTQAIRPLSLSEKRKTSIGLAVINPKTCLSHAGQRDCQLCFDECNAAGYHAIQLRQIKLELGEIPPGVLSEAELDAMGSIEAPFVDSDACIGCGLCEYRCHTTLTKQEQVLSESAIRIVSR